MAFASENEVKGLLKKNGVPIGKGHGQISARRFGAIVGAYPGNDQGEGWIQVNHRVNGDPDVPKDASGTAAAGAHEQVKHMKESHYHHLLTAAGFEHKAVSYPLETLNLYRKAI